MNGWMLFCQVHPQLSPVPSGEPSSTTNMSIATGWLRTRSARRQIVPFIVGRDDDDGVGFTQNRDRKPLFAFSYEGL